MPEYLKLIVNYLTIGIGYDKLRTEGLFRYHGLTIELFETALVIFMYILIAAVIGTFAFLLSYFEQLEITNFLFGLAFIFNFFSERGMIKEDGLSITVYGQLLIRSIVKILLLMIIYNVLIKMIELIN